MPQPCKISFNPLKVDCHSKNKARVKTGAFLDGL